jgi:hypothetical protein
MALSTKNLVDKKVSKVLEPGNHTVMLTSVKLEAVTYKHGAYHLNLNVEGPDLGKDFEGFFLDIKNEPLGRYKGQVARVRANDFPYADGETKSGIKVYRDKEIMKVIKNLCSALGCSAWFDAQDGKHDTIEQFVEQFDKDKPFADKKLRICIAGREYQNKQGYINYDLYIGKGGRGTYGYESEQVPENLSKMVKFNAETHIKKSTKKADTVTSFEKPVTEATKSQFSLD